MMTLCISSELRPVISCQDALDELACVRTVQARCFLSLGDAHVCACVYTAVVSADFREPDSCHGALISYKSGCRRCTRRVRHWRAFPAHSNTSVSNVHTRICADDNDDDHGGDVVACRDLIIYGWSNVVVIC